MNTWRNGTHIKTSADIAAKVFDELAVKNQLNAQSLVDASRPDEAPLHPEFEWNDAIAAEEWRKQRARNLITALVVIEEKEEEADAEVLTAEVIDVLKQALEEHSAMRDREGKKLCEDIAYRANMIRGYVDFVEQRSPVSVEEYRQRIAVRMEELLDGSDLAQQRILNEAAMFADKVSVTEEIVRLRSHLGQLESMLNSPVAVGRKLDFLVQELNRETNTIGSKANDYEIAKTVVEMKAEIEKIREQIQNLE